MDTTDLHIMGGTMECGPLTVLLNVFFCVQQNKEIHTGLEQLEDE